MKWPWSRREHVHHWMVNESWGADTGTTLQWLVCDTCNEYEITYRKPGPGWWAEGEHPMDAMLRTRRDRQATA